MIKSETELPRIPEYSEVKFSWQDKEPATKKIDFVFRDGDRIKIKRKSKRD